jgi:hypothetical protein
MEGKKGIHYISVYKEKVNVSLIFYPNYLENILKTLLNQFMALKNAKINPKPI